MGDWLVGGGEMGKLVRAMDWSRTPLGPMASWSASLRTTVNLALNSNFPISLAWGQQCTQIYNDGYWPICGDKHPGSMGQDFRECWASPWPVVGPAFESALAGTTAFLEDQRMFLDRLGYLEETFFTFSFSPIRDDTGQVVGLFHPVTETTGKMLAQRRTRCLRDLAERGLGAQSLVDGLHLAAEALGDCYLDVPFALFYQLDALGTTATLAAHTGLAPGGTASPQRIDFSQAQGGWPFARSIASGAPVLVEDVGELFPGLVCSPYSDPIRSAFVMPIGTPGTARPTCLLVAGASPRLPMNEDYRAFYDLLGAAVSTIVATAVAYDTERQRAENLAEIDRAKTVFFSNISHEFRTPLTLMLGPLEDKLAEEASLPPADRDERLALIHRNSLRLLKLVNALLDFARIEAGRMQAHYEPTDLAALTSDLAGNFRAACEQAGLFLQVECASLPEPVYVDPDLWEKIVLNLVSNAFKFTLHGGVTIRLQARGPVAELTVQDTGSGIPPEEMPRLFERFHRIQGTPGRSQEGSGIGLALVQELVRLHGGTIRVDSGVGAGSTFTVAIPFGKTHLPEEHLSPTHPLKPTADGARPYVEEASHWLGRTLDAATPDGPETRPRIVWADDNADMRDYVTRLLSDRYAVEAVGDGEEALAAVRRQLPDLVISDVMMPRLDGFGLLRALREDQRTRTVPIILLSARAGEEARIEGLRAGSDDYLVKPFTARELHARVAALIELARTRHEVEEARRSAQEAALLRESEERLRYVTEMAEVGTWDWDLDSGQLTWSERCRAILGLAAGKPIDYESFLASIHPDDRERTGNAIECALAGKGDYAIDYRAVWADGSQHWVHAKGRVTFDTEGRPRRMGGIAIDISERKAVEAARDLARQRFAGIVESTMDAIISVDAGMRIVLFNAAAEAMFRCPAAEALGGPLERFIPARFRAAHAGHIARFGASGTTSRAMGQPGDVQGVRTDGTEFPIEASISQIEVAGEKLYTVILRDISARVAAEAEIRRFNTELEQLVEIRTTELKGANAALESYASAIAHDLRAPLRAMTGFSQILSTRYTDRLGEEGLQHLDHIVTGARRMGDLIDGLLQLADTTRGEIARRPVDLSALARRILAELSATEPDRVVRCDIEDGLSADGDPRLLEALMRNLLGNAWKYTGKRDEAFIRVHADHARQPPHYCVSDNGAGFDMAYAGQLFQPFRRLHSQSQFPGIGIGLATVQRIVHRHGGQITAQSAPDSGASFCFTLHGSNSDKSTTRID